MSKYSNTVEYNLRTTLDKTGLTQLQTQIRQVEQQLHLIQNEELISKKSATQALATIKEVQTALNAAFNPKLGMLDNKKLISSINNIKGGLNGVYQAFAMSGTKGVQAFSQFYGQLTTVDRGLKQVSSTTDKIFNTLGNTVRWGLIASGFASVMTAARESIEYVKDLDESLTNIMMVTGYSKDQMNEYAQSANEAAKALRSTTVAMTDATLVFAQQGYDIPTSQKLATSSVKLANVSQQDTATASDEITAYMNAFKIPLEKIDNALSKWAIVANVSAADVEELSVASQKAASTANTVGINMDQLAAQIAAIETVTREAPENIGNGLKTLYARFSDIRMGETLDDGVDLGKVTSTLEKVGVQVVNAEGNMRQVGDIMEDLMEVWGDLDLTQRSSIATTLAGKFQLSRFTALMNRSDLYKEYLSASENETGTETLDMMQEVFENSLQGRLNKLQSTIENIFTNAFNTDDFYNMIDAVTQLVQVFADLTDAIGGGSNALTAFAAIATKAFSTQIGQGIGNFIYNREQNKQYKASRAKVQELAQEQLAGRGLDIGDERVQSAAKDIARTNQFRGQMSTETEERINALQKERLQGIEKELALEKELEQQMRLISAAWGGEVVKSEEEALQVLTALYQSDLEILRAEDIKTEKFKTNTNELTKAAEQAAKISSALHGQGNFGKNFKLSGIVNGTGGQTLRTVIQELQAYKETLYLTQSELKALAAADEIFEKAIKDDIAPIEAVQQLIQQYNTVLTEAARTMQWVGNEVKITPDSFRTTAAELTRQQAENKQSSLGLTGEADRLQTENVASSVTNLASATMTGMFAFQSLSAIFETLEDQELSLAQKAEQIAMNLTMVAAMGIPAITQTTEAVSKVSAAIKTWTVSTLALKTAEEGVTAAQVARALVTKAATSSYGQQLLSVIALTTGTKALTAAEIEASIAGAPLIALAAPLVAAAAAVASIVYVIGEESARLERQKQAMEDLVSASNETVATIKENKDNLDALYKEYDETKEASDEFRQALLDQAEALGIVDAKIYDSLGEYDELKDKIDEVTQAQIEQNNALLRAQRDTLFSNTTSSYAPMQATGAGLASGSNGLDFRVAELAGIDYGAEEWLPFLRDTIGEIDSQEALDRINKVNIAHEEQANKLEKLKQELESLKQIPNPTKEQEKNIAELNAEIDTTIENIELLKTALSQDGVQEALDIQSQLIDNTSISAFSAGGVLDNGSLSFNNLESTLSDSRIMGPEFAEDFKRQMSSLGAEGKDALLLSFAQKAIDANIDTQLTEDGVHLAETIQNAASRYADEAEEQGFDRDSSYLAVKNDLDRLGTNSGLSEAAQIKLIASLDMDKSLDEIRHDIDNLDAEDYFKIQISADASQVKEDIALALDAFKNDETVGEEQLSGLYTEEIVNAFKGASGDSGAFADAMELLADNSFDTQNSLIALNGALDELDHAVALDNLSESADELADKFGNATVEGQDLVDLLEEADALEDDAFNLSVDIGRDLINQADSMVEAIDDVSDAAGKIGEGFLVAAEDAKALENAFPGILENYQVTADGMIQLDQEIAQSAMGAATTDLESSSYAQAAKLNNYANYAQAMSQIYMQEAIAMAERAQADVATEEEANQYIAESEAKLADYEADLMRQHDLASMTTAENELSYNQQAAEGMSQSMNEAAQNSGFSLQNIAENAYNVAAGIINWFSNVGAAIAAGLSGQEFQWGSGNIMPTISTGGVGAISGRHIQKGQDIKIDGKSYQVGQGAGSIALAKKAVEYQAKALSLERAAGQARAAAASIQAKGLEGKDDINSAGAPKSGGGGGGKGGGGKTPKEKSKKEEEEEQIQRQARQDAGNAELDIYKKIDTWIDKLKKNYSKLNKIRNITWNKDRIKLMNLELGNLKSQQKALQERLKISKDYQKVLKNGTEAQKRSYGIETTLVEVGLTDKDADGVVDNYKEQWRVANAEAKKWEDKAEAYFKAHGGKVDKYGNALQDSLMYEEERQEYQNLVDTAKNYYNIVEKIEDTTNKYEETWKEIQETEEQALDLLLQMQDIQIEAYTKSLESLDTLKEMRDIMADMIGMWSGFELDSPFRGLVEDLQQVKDLFEDSDYDAGKYYDNIIETLQRKKAQASKELQANYDAAIKFYQAEKEYAKKNKDGLGTGELAQASRKLSEMQRWMDNPNVVDNPYAVYDEASKKWIVNTQQLLEDFTEQYKKVTSLALEAEKAWEEVQKNIIDALDEEAERLDKIYDKYDDTIKGLEREADRVKLFYGEDSYSDLAKLADKTGKTALEKAKQYQKEYQYWEKQQKEIAVQDEKERQRRIKEAQDILDKAQTKEEKANGQLLLEQANQYTSEEWEWYDERMRETYQKVRDEQDKAAQAFKEAFSLQIQELEAQWLESALGTRDAKYKLDDWNRDKEYMTKYKDDVEREYEIEKLKYKWQKMLNNASDASLKIQKKLKAEGQEIVDQLANQVTMSEYDVKLANARLEILQKQIALEEAQQNKNQMKLQRDTQGNYKYVYAKDLDDIADKRDELLQSIYDVYEMSKQHYIDSQTEYLNAVIEAGEKAAEIWSDTSLTIEERQALIDELVADTGRLLTGVTQDVEDGFLGMSSALEWGVAAGNENIARMSEDILQTLSTRNEELIEAIGIPWDNELQSKMQNLEQLKDNFRNVTTDMRESAEYFADSIQNKVTGIASVTGEAYGDVTGALQRAEDATRNLYNETLKLYTLFGLESDALKEAQKTLEKYRDALDAATSGSGDFADKIREANQSIIKEAKASGDWITEAAAPEKTKEGEANQNIVGFSTTKNIIVPKIQKVSVANPGDTSGDNAIHSTYSPSYSAAGGYGGAGGGGGGNVSAAKTGGKGLYRATSSSGTVIGYWTNQSRAASEVLKYGNGVGSVSQVPMVYKSGYTLEGAAGKRALRYATGGYTGSWSDNGIDEKNGKWAILHQKELVLNAADTQNILAAVDLVRQMTDELKVASLNTTFNNYNKTQTQGITDTIEQRVEIAAEFPNASSADEIKQALLNLSDAAMRYSYRER